MRDASLSRVIEDAAKRHEVDPLLVHSVIRVESNYDPFAISPKGAQGLMQLMPATARRFQVSNAFDPLENVDGGVRYLRYLLDLFQDEKLALAAYNAGEGAVARYGATPPYRETMDYVQKVGKTYGEARKAAAATVAERAAAPVHPPIEQYVDAEGVLHVRTVDTR